MFRSSLETKQLGDVNETRIVSCGLEIPYSLTISERDEKLRIIRQGIRVVF